MIKKEKEYKCDDCPNTATFSGYRKAREAGWAVAKDYSTCYCPLCAPNHRRGKAAEKNAESVQLSDSWKQLKIENLR